MKKILLVCAAAAGALAFACGSDDDDGDKTQGADGTAVTAPTVAPADGTALPPDVQTAIASQITPGTDATVRTVDTTVAIDANAATEDIDGQGSYGIGQEFTVVFAITEGGGEYVGYQFDIMWDPVVVSYVKVKHLEVEGLDTCPVPVVEENRFAAACLDDSLTATSYTGRLSEVTFKCEAAGQSILHLRSPSEGKLGTKVEAGRKPIKHTITAIDATISCG